MYFKQDFLFVIIPFIQIESGKSTCFVVFNSFCNVLFKLIDDPTNTIFLLWIWYLYIIFKACFKRIAISVIFRGSLQLFS